ncbi:MAG: bifunctional 4-hydroxy-2-oxoglutarate aldolase/2-dehydro-3-deoxy-phosphogluconate aldolase [Gloeomargarita sp. SKYBB_i_bin120]|nr:bifunctional 4-hydroxy-2-oxoglutarate aldolase/2-dehydro-3-deoxy-phosphogluconate aldolase [Gloeomargarita sp. SKYG98]MCS7293113.1 bifunctional 4-hydroxy-2-oxoglutarate aldolase/2-dehydro-3-deoxy-phosphogluconate aldolase [Gloeomargarita sp. SKYB120]MDW8178678.1 bifunctional 4-hydroxy-2-oxoglutarate aldolase/2-dehydro-3-deoxy-phosphogluconate aldolase [Gloeomargarita sp. SKYBB_i_bin120]
MDGIDAWLKNLQRHRLIGIVRAGEPELAYQMGATLAQAGFRFIEVTWDCPDVEVIIPRLQIAYPDCWVGTGTIRRDAELEAALSLGVDFILTPHTQREWLGRSRTVGIPLVPGALTPTEILHAYQLGAPAVKVFPIASVGGTSYLRHLRQPLGPIPLIPTGGVTRANAQAFLEAGAIAVGLGRDLFPEPWYSQRDWVGLAQELGQWLKGLGLTAGAATDSP